ncbi:MAG: bifunctional (p)ppGpp synthetase/guanosine-3',5'-bis(diphosphate) 3'-pyrophosphohydrolase [Petrotogaceae bacterium]|jgi:GTP pyrophosphokinase|nr:bifunctional (p)ppGpp synthetase/guanosine-3',5'-bis(diphosphate) 3'-pyrophosphohydrolase [Petrotogaceae bacterium]
MEQAQEYLREIQSIFKRELTAEEASKITVAYDLAQISHQGQMRASGEPFFEHPKEVGRILAKFNMDVDTIASGLLHDVCEDCGVPIDVIREKFGNDVARIVDGVTKISNLKLNEKLSKADTKSIEKIETLRKMLLAMSTDLRVIIVKLSDRLHNMRTLAYTSHAQQTSKAQETLKIYAPIAHRLGIHTIKAELEDLSFFYLYPDSYNELKIRVDNKLSDRQKSIEEYSNLLNAELAKHNITAKVYGRSKHIYSIWDKMVRKGKSFDEIYDFIALRIITENQNQCYASLGIVHSLWPPIPGRIKDYIATPKLNGYKSLHTTVITNKGEPLEIQIRDWQMHQEAEYGLAAHWAYKMGVGHEKIKFLQNLMELHKDIAQSAFDLNEIESELDTAETFVFTPHGEIIHLPKDATPIDFAYAIHTDVGNHFAGSKINGKIVPISHKLQNGDVVEIIINRNFQGPSMDWLKYARSARTKSKIKKYYRQKNEQLLIEQGKDKFREIAKKLGFSIEDVLLKLKESAFYLKFNIKNDEDLYAKLSLDDVNYVTIKNYVVGTEDKKQSSIKNKSSSSKPTVLIQGMDGVESYYAKCCMPVPGDEIIGVLSRRGIGIHRKNCKIIRDVSDEKVVKVSWNSYDSYIFTATLNIEMKSKEVMNSIRSVITAERASIEMYEMERQLNSLMTKMRVKVNNVEHLTRVIQKISEVNGVSGVKRS